MNSRNRPQSVRSVRSDHRSSNPSTALSEVKSRSSSLSKTPPKRSSRLPPPKLASSRPISSHPMTGMSSRTENQHPSDPPGDSLLKQTTLFHTAESRSLIEENQYLKMKQHRLFHKSGVGPSCESRSQTVRFVSSERVPGRVTGRPDCSSTERTSTPWETLRTSIPRLLAASWPTGPNRAGASVRRV